MRILFLGDVVGPAGCSLIRQNLYNQKQKKNIDFVVLNGENAADNGVGITEKIANEFFESGADVITTGNHVRDQKETANHIEKENRLLRHDVKELQEQVYTLYKRIAELTNDNMEQKTSDRN